MSNCELQPCSAHEKIKRHDKTKRIHKGDGNKTQKYKERRRKKKMVMQQTRFITSFVLIFLESNPLNLAGSAILNLLRSLMVKFSHVRVSFWLEGGGGRGVNVSDCGRMIL